MSKPIEATKLSSRIQKFAPVRWRDLHFIQHEEFKELSDEARKRLKASILQNQFSDPFKVWHDKASGKIYCLDGKHRTMILDEIEKDGNKVPEMLPAVFLKCDDQREAAKLVLQFSSVYAHVTKEGYVGFIEMHQLDPGELLFTIDIPGLTSPIVPGIPEGNFSDEGIGVKNQYGVIVLCADEQDQEKIFKVLTEQGHQCKVVVT